MEEMAFTVDSHLLRELGERLVAKPYIALAELIKNSYDADATEVVVTLSPNDSITVSDNGHGMDLGEFRDFWMRIGSPHKDKSKESRGFHRRMTGSKGVGRLAVQFLAEQFEMTTVSDKDLSTRLEAKVRWADAVETGDLTNAKVLYQRENSKTGYEKRTVITLRKLKQQWDLKQIKGLAREIWFLSPPFLAISGIPEGRQFQVKLVTPQRNLREMFEKQMRAIMAIWYARIVGSSEKGKVDLSIEFAGEEPEKAHLNIEHCELEKCEFEIRVFALKWKQPHGILLETAREYLNEWGGVHVYDKEFHLPYYGTPTSDWLEIEQDHSHRRTLSKFLPKRLQVPDGLSWLPTASRMLGIVKVDTSREKNLSISITRDRLQETISYENLRTILRSAIDLYAMRECARQLTLKRRTGSTARPAERVETVRKIIGRLQNLIPDEEYRSMEEELDGAVEQIRQEERENISKITSLASFASAGIAAIAYRHQLSQQFERLNDLIARMANVETKDASLARDMASVRSDLADWLEKAKSLNMLFAHLGTPENVSERLRLEAKPFIDMVARDLKSLARGIPVLTSRLDDPDLNLPRGSVAEWSSIFQNVFINAFNAMIDSEKKEIDVSYRKNEQKREIIVQDTGSGIDLELAEGYFEPFRRGIGISNERRELGYGGNGLGLTIVRLVADGLGCKVAFIRPERGYSTAFSLSWEEME